MWDDEASGGDEDCVTGGALQHPIWHVQNTGSLGLFPVADVFRSASRPQLQGNYMLSFWGGKVQTKMSWRSPLTSQYSTLPLGIKVQSCPVLR